jgi:myo-inositol-1(or 4)-monophosphatase
VSVALVVDRKIACGVIYDPLREECYSAAAGHGAWLNGQKLQASGTRTRGDALVAVSLPTRVRSESPDLLDFVQIVQLCQAIRRSGSAALNLAHVASGALDAFWATHIHPWDVAAGVLLIREAGGFLTARDGSEFDLWKPHFISAATRELHGELFKELTRFRAT